MTFIYFVIAKMRLSEDFPGFQLACSLSQTQATELKNMPVRTPVRL